MNPVLDQSIYIDHDGNMFRKLPNWGRGQCGLISLIQLYDVLRNGVDLGEVVRKTTGEPNDDMMERVRQLRARIIAEADTELEGYFDPSLQKNVVAKLLQHGHLPTLRIWKEAHSADSGWLDLQAMFIGAKILGVQRFMIVDTRDKTTNVERTGEETAKEEVGLHLHQIYRPDRLQGYSSLVLYTADHYEALYQVKIKDMCFFFGKERSFFGGTVALRPMADKHYCDISLFAEDCPRPPSRRKDALPNNMTLRVSCM